MQSFATAGTEGILETFLKMIKQEGLFRPIRGMSAVVVGAGPSHALYFSSYEFLKNTLTQYTTSEKYHTLVWGKSVCSLFIFSFIIIKSQISYITLIFNH